MTTKPNIFTKLKIKTSLHARSTCNEASVCVRVYIYCKIKNCKVSS